MKRFIFIITTLAFLGVPAFATPSIEFSPDAGSAGNWSYDGVGTLTFNQDVTVPRFGQQHRCPGRLVSVCPDVERGRSRLRDLYSQAAG